MNKWMLSVREVEVLEKIIQGRTTSEIAFDLDVALETVKSHRKNILGKMKVGIVPAAILWDRWAREYPDAP